MLFSELVPSPGSSLVSELGTTSTNLSFRFDQNLGFCRNSVHSREMRREPKEGAVFHCCNYLGRTAIRELPAALSNL